MLSPVGLFAFFQCGALVKVENILLHSIATVSELNMQQKLM